MRSESQLDSPERLQILIVEDDDDARESLREILELHRHRVSTKSTARDALLGHDELASFDVILLDRRLPDGIAEELLPTFRAKAPKADIIIVTGFAELDASIAAIRQGVTDYMIKPICPELLQTSLQRIGRRRRIESELAKQHQFAELVLQTAEAIILELDERGRIIRFNQFFSDLTGYELDEVVHRDWFETFIPHQQSERVHRLFHQTICDRTTRGVINPILTKTGETKQIRWSNAVLKDPSGNVTGIISVGLDVSDLVAAQQRVLQSERLATIGQTMTGLAHESRNALQRLQNAVELLEDELADNAEALRYVEKISRAGTDLRDLLEEVRAYAAPIKLDIAPVSLQAVWRRAWESMQARYPEYQAGLVETSFDRGKPIVQGDALRLQRVFRNLFENAFDASGPDVEVRIEYDTAPDSITVAVKDNGPGMAKEQRAHVFDAFYTTKSSGTGLGLALAQRIIAAHHGTIEVVDTKSTDQGTEFKLRLPRMSEPILEDPNSPE